jgi:threonine/homoserine/homoserine lactone efflux protein
VEGRSDAAVRFTLAAALIEIPYALIAIKFQALLERSPWLTDNFKLIAAIVLFILGISSLLTHRKQRTNEVLQSGFRKGILVSIFNPMAIPFWIAVTAYLVQHEWVDLNQAGGELAYIGGLALGTLSLLFGLIVLGKRLVPYFRNSEMLKRVPGIAFILLGLYSLAEYFHFL